MALETTITGREDLRLISANKMTRQITLQINKEGGYPLPVNSVVIKFQDPFGNGQDGTVKYVNTFDPNHPEWLVIPTASQIASGKTFEVDSYKIGVTKEDQSYYTFKDGVINVDGYVGLETVAVEGNEGDEFIVGTGFDQLLEKYDSIIVDDSVYQLLKHIPTNAGQVIYLDKPLTKDVTSVVFAERSNLKIYNDFRTKCIIAKASHVLGGYSRGYIKGLEDAFLKVIRNKMAAEIFFDQGDYEASDRLLRENIEIGTYLKVLKGGQLWL